MVRDRPAAHSASGERPGGLAAATAYMETRLRVELTERKRRWPSDMFGELSIFDPGPRTSTATAITDVRAAAMDRDVLRAWIADHPEIAERLLRRLARRLRRTDDDLSDLIFTDLAGRVAKQLPRLAQRFGTQEDGAMRVDHYLTQVEIAQLVGAAHETVNKVLTDSPSAAGSAWTATGVDCKIRTPCPPSALRCARRVVLSLNGYEHCSQAAAIGPAG